MAVQRAWIIRHGQTDWNVQHRWQGLEPTHLNAEGWLQARALADHLRDVALDAIYTSDLPRAYETASALAEGRAFSPQVDLRLRELNVGIFSGITHPELLARHPQEIQRWMTGDFDYVIPNGESRRELQTRALAAFEAIVSHPTYEQVAIVTHGGTLRVLVNYICAGDPLLEGKLEIPNTSYTLIERTPQNSWRIVTLTSTAHLLPKDTTDSDGAL